MWRSRVLQNFTITSVLSFEGGGRMKRRDNAVHSSAVYGVGSPASLGSSLQRIMQKTLNGLNRCDSHAPLDFMTSCFDFYVTVTLSQYPCGSYLPGHTDVAEGLEACFSHHSALC
jgi:hypothetical protein